jgi:protein-S-isoprenylcysteine O-methyltransferase Ste14
VADVGRAHADYRKAERALAVVLGIGCHLAFAVAVAAMIAGLHEGLSLGRGRFVGAAAWAANTLLALQFPLLHSALLTPRGQRWLGRTPLGRDLATTSYVGIASLQLALVFALWSPLDVSPLRLAGPWRAGSEAAFAGSWALVMVSMRDAGLDLQLGFLGWGAVARGRRPVYRPFPTRGLFAWIRQPIYLAFALTLWTGPVVSRDRLLLGALWTTYCGFGPRWKERRYLARDPNGYRRYQALVPYWLPRLRRKETQPQ